METDEEEDQESELSEIYDMFPEQKGMNTPKRTDSPVIINTPTRQQKTGTNFSICMAKIPTSVVNDKEFISSIEKYKIARVQDIPSEDNDLVDVIIVAIARLPRQLKFKKSIILITRAEEMSSEQREIFKNIIQ